MASASRAASALTDGSTARARLSARAEALARALLVKRDAIAPTSWRGAPRATAASARKVLDALARLGFRRDDVEAGARAIAKASKGAFCESDVLDWLCLNVPNARLPRRFQTEERAEHRLDGEESVEATAARANASAAPRRVVETVDEGMTRVTGKKDIGVELGDGGVDKAWIARYAEYEESETESESDGYDSLEDFGLSEEEATAKRLMWNRRRDYARNPSKVLAEFTVELAELKARASEAKKGKNKKEQKDVAEAIRKLKLMATELGISEDDIDPPREVIDIKTEETRADDADSKTSGAKVNMVVSVPAACAEKAESTPYSHGNSDDEAFEFDVFGDSAEAVIGAGEEDPVELLVKKFKRELLFADGKRVDTGAQAKGGSKKSVKSSQVEEMTPKNMLTQLAKREGWLVPRFERDKSADGIRYTVTVERSAGPKFKRKPTLECSTRPEDEPDSGWASINDAQNGASLRALFEAVFSEECQIIPVELSENYQELWTRWAIEYVTSDVTKTDEAAQDEFVKSLMSLIDKSASTTGDDVAKNELERNSSDTARESSLRASRGPSDRLKVAQDETSKRLKSQLQATREDPEWKKMFAKRSQLPICALADDLLDRLRSNDAVVVCGETGCGKTTQVPQFLLDDAIDRGQGGICNIVCTQPRRVAATSIAERVSVERCEKNGVGGAGSLVGHHVRLDAKITDTTRLTFCTTGILLRRLQGDRMLTDVTHVVVDEVHERSLDGDFLLTLLRDLPRRRRDAGMPPVKLVLMSATLNAALFSDYLSGAPIISAPGRSFPVETVYLEQIYDTLDYVIDPDNRSCRRPKGKTDQAMKAIRAGGGGDRRRQNDLLASWGEDAASEFGGEENPENPDYDPSKYEFCKRNTRLSLSRLDESVIDYDLIEELLAYVDETTDNGAILVFLPGIGEVTGLVDRLAGSPRFKDAVLTPLHSALTNAEQREAFKVPRAGIRKIVVATNVAETSVTIEDIVVVIDTGRVKERQWDPRRGMASLEEGWVSRAAAKQRAGRAGRVRAGTCYALFTSHRANGSMRPFQIPEMHRAPLTEVVLQIASLDLHNDAAVVLGNAPEPPKDEAIAAAKKTLTEIGAFDELGKLTPLGRHLAALPVDARVAKMLLFGAILRCLSPILTIAATLSYKSPFQSSKASNSQVEAAMRAFAQPASDCLAAGQQSDHLVFAAAYDGYIAAAKESRNDARRFAQKNALDVDTIRQISEMRTQYAALLADMGIIQVPAGYSLRGKNTSWLDDPKAVRC